MRTLQDEYLAHIIELRDAGRQLMHLFLERCQQALTISDRNRVRRYFLETELYVLKLEELIGKLNPQASRHA